MATKKQKKDQPASAGNEPKREEIRDKFLRCEEIVDLIFNSSKAFDCVPEGFFSVMDVFNQVVSADGSGNVKDVNIKTIRRRLNLMVEAGLLETSCFSPSLSKQKVMYYRSTAKGLLANQKLEAHRSGELTGKLAKLIKSGSADIEKNMPQKA